MIDPIPRAHASQAEDHASLGGAWKPQSEADSDAASVRADLERLRQRESQIMQLINCKHPDKLMHDLRNILNELQLLRMLVESEKSD